MNFSDNNCIICNTPLHGRADKTTCSDACRVRLHRLRQNESFQQPSKGHEELQTGHYAPLDLPWLKQQPITSTERDYQNRWDAQEDEEDEEDQEDIAEQKRLNEAALAEEMHGHYEKVIDFFLQKENKHLETHRLRRMLRFTTDAYEAYKLHPYLSQPDSIAQKRMQDLRKIIVLIQETHQKSKGKLFGNTSRYELTEKWRRKLQERMLE